MTTETMTPIGHKTLQLRDLMPSKSAAFSPNFYRWMKSKAHFYRDGGVAESVYRVKPGSRTAESFGADTLMIGYPYDAYPGDADFSGMRLMAVLCNGSKADRACYPNIFPDLVLLEGFWDRYLQVGRCVIDPEHHEHFMGGDRYQEGGDQRTCLWCGVVQAKVSTPRTVVDVSWAPV